MVVNLMPQSTEIKKTSYDQRPDRPAGSHSNPDAEENAAVTMGMPSPQALDAAGDRDRPRKTEMFRQLGRYVLNFIPKRTVMRILTGPNRGLRWVVGSGTHGCWLGTYESEFARRIVSAIRPGMTAFDVGAHSGYYTLLMARLVGSSGRVFAFEPNRKSAACLKHHLEINDIRNVEVIEAAVAESVGRSLFTDTDYSGQLGNHGRVVPTVRLDDYPSPDFVKMDIEGAEGLALRGADRILSKQETIWYIELHGPKARTECKAILRDKDCFLEWLGSAELFAIPKRLCHIPR